MINRATLTRLAKVIAGEMDSGRLSPATQLTIRSFEETPELLLELIELIAKEGTKKRPNNRLIGAFAFLLAHGLEFVRYAVERGDKASIALVARLRDHLLESGSSGHLGPPLLLVILEQFADAKLDMGDELRELMQRLIEEYADARPGSERAEGDALGQLARELGCDPFVIHPCLDESAEAMPEELRARFVMVAFGEKEPAVREAVLGFLLNSSSLVCARVAELIELAAPHGLVSPTMLRRMITMRNWLPAVDQPSVDKAIKACRKEGIACESWPRPAASEVLASGIDGSGAQTILVVTGDAGRPALAGLLVKHGIGVRDAWVRRGMTAEDLEEVVGDLAGEIDIAPSDIAYAGTVIRHFLAANIQSGIMPPFGLLDFVELAGLCDVNPAAKPVDTLVLSLCDAIDPAELSEAAVTRTLRDSVHWRDEHPTLTTWFEDNVEGIIGTKRAPKARQMAALLAGPLQSRRRRWAEIVAWTAVSLQHRPGGRGWEGFAIVARELLGRRPLDEIGIMKAVADATLTAKRMQGWLGSRSAA